MSNSHQTASKSRLSAEKLSIYLLAIALVIQIFLPSPTTPIARAASFDIPNSDITALKAALNTPGTSHTINLAPGGVYTLTTVDNFIPYVSGGFSNGLPVINKDITINGNGATLTRLDTAPAFRFFYITDTGKLTINNLTVSNGNEDYGGGGAILNRGSALTINYSTFSNNYAIGDGGAIGSAILATAEGLGPLSPVTMTITVNYSTFNNNKTFDTGSLRPSLGGAIASLGTTTPGITILSSNVTIITSINGSTFTNNLTGHSGNLAGNALGYGGAIYNGVQKGQGALAGIATAIMTVTNSTFNNNKAEADKVSPRAYGGAIANIGQSFDASSSLATMTVVNSTFSNNRVNNGLGGAIFIGQAGYDTSNATLKNVLLAENLPDNCNSVGGTFLPGSANLEYTDGTAGAATCGAGSTVTIFQPMATSAPVNNGGPTQTIALSATSPALDAGDDAVCNNALVSQLDQRGITRPFGTHCDIGAFEAGGYYLVKNDSDSGDGFTPGSLSFPLKYAVAGQQIRFGLSGANTVNVGRKLPPLPSGVAIFNDCSSPKVIIIGTGVTGTGLTLSGNNSLTGLFIHGFSGRQLLTTGPGNQLHCTKANRV